MAIITLECKLIVYFYLFREPFLTYQNGNIAKMWKPVNFHGKDLKFLLIDNQNVIMVPEPRQNAIKFWESLGLPDTPPTIVFENPPTTSQVPHLPITPESMTIQVPPAPTPTIAYSESQYRVAFPPNNNDYLAYENSLLNGL